MTEREVTFDIQRHIGVISKNDTGWRKELNIVSWNTRWSGLQRGSVHEDATDDAEYSGNLIYLLKSATEFIRRNTR